MSKDKSGYTHLITYKRYSEVTNLPVTVEFRTVKNAVLLHIRAIYRKNIAIPGTIKVFEL
jgi:hypothetical protein